ncbi:MAG: molybdate ABC transporter substrate-binding protein [Opitutaceae bacterium]
MKLLRLSTLILAAVAAFSLRAAELNLFAAASLSDALKEIAKTYEPKSGDKLVFNLAASSTLALQIKQGAPADVFFSADEAKMDDLAKAGLLIPETRRSLLSNTLAIVVAVDGNVALTSPADLAKSSFGRIALAEPQTVPAGIYAKEWLQKTGLWKSVIDKVVPTENVRACLAAVESGNVDAGIIYKTDALISKKVKIAYEVSVAEGPKISYPLAVIKASKQREVARKFTTYLAGAEARAVFTKYGFLPAP